MSPRRLVGVVTLVAVVVLAVAILVQGGLTE
jgi:hypothetical protein